MAIEVLPKSLPTKLNMAGNANNPSMEGDDIYEDPPTITIDPLDSSQSEEREVSVVFQKAQEKGKEKERENKGDGIEVVYKSRPKTPPEKRGSFTGENTTREQSGDSLSEEMPEEKLLTVLSGESGLSQKDMGKEKRIKSG